MQTANFRYVRPTTLDDWACYVMIAVARCVDRTSLR
jgi:hypothetical protein